MATTIVKVLREYGAIPAGFLARVVGRRPEEIQDCLAKMNDEKIVTIDETDKVALNVQR